jgi:hypothetical protein
MPESIGNLFPTQVPSYTESADIRQAFNLYHYGTTTVPSNENDILPESMAGYIRDTLAALENVEAGVSAISNLGLTTNLNDVTDTGVYNSTGSPSVDLNYPSTANGILVAYNASGTTYQSYHTSGATNNLYLRSTQFGTSTWSSWSLVSKDGHTHDTRYYTKSQIDNKINTTLTENSAAIVDATGKITSSPLVSQTELELLEGASANIQSQLNDKAPASHDHNNLYYTKAEQPKIYVQQSQPSGASVGDLWFW